MKISVIQDGADFYFRIPGVREAQVNTAPFKVADFDMKAAKKARNWFIENICYDSGFIPVFEEQDNA